MKVKIYSTIILPVVCTVIKLGLTLMLKRRFRVFENRVLRKIFGPSRGGGKSRLEKAAQ